MKNIKVFKSAPSSLPIKPRRGRPINAQSLRARCLAAGMDYGRVKMRIRSGWAEGRALAVKGDARCK